MIISTPKKPKTIADHLLQPTFSFKNTAAENARANGTHCNTAVALASFMLIKAVRKKIVQPTSPVTLSIKNLIWFLSTETKSSFLK